MHPCRLIFVSQPKGSICNEQFMLTTKAEQPQSVVVHFSHAMTTEHAPPDVISLPNSVIEVTQQDGLILSDSLIQTLIKRGVKFILNNPRQHLELVQLMSPKRDEDKA